MNLDPLRILFDFGLAVLIWVVQLIIYPSFKKYTQNNLIGWHKLYMIRIALIVVPLMIGQLILSGWQLYIFRSGYTVSVFLMVLFLWIFTFTHFAPLHQRISNGSYTPYLLDQLEKRNWARTVLWTLIFIWGFAETYFYSIK